MRATLFLLLAMSLFGLFLWVTLSGASFVFFFLIWLIILVITVGYPDTMVLYLLGAREIRSSDEKEFFEAASQEAYKLSVKMPRLYFYNGSLERAFVLQHRHANSLILSKGLLEKCSSAELRSISFELLLQIKKGMATKRTKSMLVLGFMAWITHSFMAMVLALLPFKNLRKASNWFSNFFLHPVLDFVFKLIIGEGYFRKLENVLADFPFEKEQLERVGLRLRKPLDYYSLPSRKLLELSSVNKSRHYQNIMALEFLPHEWDYLFNREEMKRAE
jgi:Na+-transporting methylmalonyl-CoA/oxaloacetate decarboxylase gamma subunit